MNQNSVNQKTIDDLIAHAETQECVFWNKELVISYKLPNGFTVLGRSACVDLPNFDLDIGRILCKKKCNTSYMGIRGIQSTIVIGG